MRQDSIRSHVFRDKETGLSYKRTYKNIARRQLTADPERRFFLVGSNVSPFHFRAGWYLSTHDMNIAKLSAEGETFDGIIQEMLWNQSPELGKRVVVYVEIR